jgi:hypothetical protein
MDCESARREEQERILALIAEEKKSASELNNPILSATLTLLETRIRMV